MSDAVAKGVSRKDGAVLYHTIEKKKPFEHCHSNGEFQISSFAKAQAFGPLSSAGFGSFDLGKSSDFSGCGSMTGFMTFCSWTLVADSAAGAATPHELQPTGDGLQTVVGTIWQTS